MIMARANFGRRPANVEQDEFEDLVHTYMAMLLHNWQILHDYNLAWLDGQLQCYSSLPCRDSVGGAYSSRSVEQALEKLRIIGAQMPEWELLDNGSDEELKQWQTDTSFVLYSHFLDKSSPLMCMSAKCPVAICRTSLSEELREDLFRWTGEYRAIDKLWMSSGELEIAAYTQMCEIDSALSQGGRQLCSLIEKATEVRTFYYQYRNWGRLSNARNSEDVWPELRVCPGCGADWKRRALQPPGLRSRNFFDFAFKCDDCRLVSNEATDVDDAERAQYGEWKARN